MITRTYEAELYGAGGMVSTVGMKTPPALWSPPHLTSFLHKFMVKTGVTGVVKNSSHLPSDSGFQKIGGHGSLLRQVRHNSLIGIFPRRNFCSICYLVTKSFVLVKNLSPNNLGELMLEILHGCMSY